MEGIPPYLTYLIIHLIVKLYACMYLLSIQGFRVDFKHLGKPGIILIRTSESRSLESRHAVADNVATHRVPRVLVESLPPSHMKITGYQSNRHAATPTWHYYYCYFYYSGLTNVIMCNILSFVILVMESQDKLT